jgi:hypothetical protein
MLLLSFPAMCLAIVFGLSVTMVMPLYQAMVGLWFLSIVLVILRRKK